MAAPSEFPIDSRTIDCISSIVTGPIGNQRDQVPVGLDFLGDQSSIALGGLQFFERGTDFAHYFEVRAFAPSANMVLLAGSSSLEDCQQGFAMFSYEQPVPN